MDFNFDTYTEENIGSEFLENNEIVPEEENLVPISNRKLITNKFDKSVQDLLAMIDRGLLNLQPEYQRNYVWKSKQQSKFIESMILGIPIPTIFISENQDSTSEVIDGQQRLTTLRRFWKDEFKLSGLETLAELNGKRFSDLDSATQTTLEFNRPLSVVSITKESSDDIKFDIFMRLNEGAVKLSPQELRNVMYRGKIIELLKELSQNHIFKQLFSENSITVLRKTNQEIILRMLSINDIVDGDFVLASDYNGRLNTTMGKFLDKYRNDEDSIEEFKKHFADNMEKLSVLLTTNEIFRNLNDSNSLISRPIAEFEYILVDRLSISQVEDNKESIKDYLRQVFEHQASLFQRATANKDTLLKRLELIELIVKKVRNG